MIQFCPIQISIPIPFCDRPKHVQMPCAMPCHACRSYLFIFVYYPYILAPRAPPSPPFPSKLPPTTIPPPTSPFPPLPSPPPLPRPRHPPNRRLPPPHQLQPPQPPRPSPTTTRNLLKPPTQHHPPLALPAALPPPHQLAQDDRQQDQRGHDHRAEGGEPACALLGVLVWGLRGEGGQEGDKGGRTSSPQWSWKSTGPSRSQVPPLLLLSSSLSVSPSGRFMASQTQNLSPPSAPQSQGKTIKSTCVHTHSVSMP